MCFMSGVVGGRMGTTQVQRRIPRGGRGGAGEETGLPSRPLIAELSIILGGQVELRMGELGWDPGHPSYP